MPGNPDTVLSEAALSFLVPILKELADFDAIQVRGMLEANGFALQEWDKVKTDWLTIEQWERAPMEGRA